jgi:hypothetical protein
MRQRATEVKRHKLNKGANVIGCALVVVHSRAILGAQVVIYKTVTAPSSSSVTRRSQNVNENSTIRNYHWAGRCRGGGLGLILWSSPFSQVCWSLVHENGQNYADTMLA